MEVGSGVKRFQSRAWRIFSRLPECSFWGNGILARPGANRSSQSSFTICQLTNEILAIHRSPVIPADQKLTWWVQSERSIGPRARQAGPVPTAPAADTVALLTALWLTRWPSGHGKCAATTQPVSMEAHSGLAEAVSRLTAANAELMRQHRMAVELGQAEIAKRDDAVAHYQRQEAELDRGGRAIDSHERRSDRPSP